MNKLNFCLAHLNSKINYFFLKFGRTLIRIRIKMKRIHDTGSFVLHLPVKLIFKFWRNFFFVATFMKKLLVLKLFKLCTRMVIFLFVACLRHVQTIHLVRKSISEVRATI